MQRPEKWQRDQQDNQIQDRTGGSSPGKEFPLREASGVGNRLPGGINGRTLEGGQQPGPDQPANAEGTDRPERREDPGGSPSQHSIVEAEHR